MQMYRYINEDTIYPLPIPYNATLDGIPTSNLHLSFLNDVSMANTHGWYELVKLVTDGDNVEISDIFDQTEYPDNVIECTEDNDITIEQQTEDVKQELEQNDEVFIEDNTVIELVELSESETNVIDFGDSIPTFVPVEENEIIAVVTDGNESQEIAADMHIIGHTEEQIVEQKTTVSNVVLVKKYELRENKIYEVLRENKIVTDVESNDSYLDIEMELE